MAPKLNHRRALFVLEKIDEILHWERTTERERDTRFVELGRYLCEVRAGQYWRVDNLKSFDEFLEKKFPESRRKAYYLMAIHEQLPRETHRDLKEMGWTKARELVRVARAERQNFDCAPWVHKAKEMPREEFKREVERHLTGKETEPWEMLYFKVYKSQLAVIEQALETASLMLGGQKARGYCLEMICADFLAGANLDASGNVDSLLLALNRIYLLLPNSQRQEFLLRIPKSVVKSAVPKRPRLRLDRDSYRELCQRVLKRDGWRCQQCGSSNSLQVHHMQPRSHLGGDVEENLITLCGACHRQVHLVLRIPSY